MYKKIKNATKFSFNNNKSLSFKSLKWEYLLVCKKSIVVVVVGNNKLLQDYKAGFTNK